jgi:hypothetical protein
MYESKHWTGASGDWPHEGGVSIGCHRILSYHVVTAIAQHEHRKRWWRVNIAARLQTIYEVILGKGGE